jgi:hypothetical protein
MSNSQSNNQSAIIVQREAIKPLSSQKQFLVSVPTATGAGYRRSKKAVELILADTSVHSERLFPTHMTRKQAIAKVKRCLQKQTISPVMERKAKSIMSLFVLEAEELLEAGISYEHVCALQRHWLI